MIIFITALFLFFKTLLYAGLELATNKKDIPATALVLFLTFSTTIAYSIYISSIVPGIMTGVGITALILFSFVIGTLLAKIIPTK